MKRRRLLSTLALAAPALLAGLPAAARDLTFDRFSVVVRGSGPDVIFVAGLGCSREVWDGVVAGLGGRYRSHLVQVAGFAGEPSRANRHGDIAAGVAEGIAGYIASSGLARPAIVGHSMGGTIALMVAARQSGAIGRVMVVDMLPDLAAAAVGPDASPQRIAAMADEVGSAMEHSDDAAYEKSVVARIDDMVLTASLRAAIVRQAMASDRLVAASAMRGLIETDLRRSLPQIAVPATVLYAWNRTYPYSRAQADDLYRSAYAGLRHVRLIRVDDSAHFIFFDQPAVFEARLVTFLDA